MTGVGYLKTASAGGSTAALWVSAIRAATKAEVGFGSILVVQRKPAAAHHDAAVHEAGIGQKSTVTYGV
jgi:hypothetical protein